MDGAHQVADVAGAIEDVGVPEYFAPCGGAGQCGHAVTKVTGKEKIPVQQQHVGFDVEETEGDGSMTQGFEGKRHNLKSEFGRWKAD